ncbi:uncharacterized protein LOC141685182 [Apium graveolens]|uniref:uncharacterized protein LOC141685182 n=1 Tax=Apium graveolens TaxID=4045 RepID=UPI003D7A419B
MECVTSVRYSIIHEGEVFGDVVPTRGIRQGDHISPYLFILCAEGLSSLIRKYEREKWLHGCKIAQGAPTILHMLFTDDSYINCRATLEEAGRVLELLKIFEVGAGQKVNFEKSSVYFSKNTKPVTKDIVLTTLAMRVDDDNILYLGLPRTMGRNKSAMFRSLKDKMRSRIQGWDGKWFSGAGKEVLIKMVLRSIPTYMMIVFLLPNKVCHDIEGLISVYWWKSSRHGKGIYWRAWERLSTNKFNAGMGFKNIRDFNLTMLERQGWRLVQFENSLIGRVFKEIYYPNGNFLSAQLGRNPSYVWRSILEAQTLLKRGARWRIRDGCNIYVLEQHWLIDLRNPFITTQNIALQGEWTIYGKSAYKLLQRTLGRWTENEENKLWRDQLKKRMAKISLVWCGIWRARNDIVLNNKKAKKETVVTNATAYLTQWKDVQKLEKATTPTPVISAGNTEQWSKPDVGCVKVNCDATIFIGSKQFGVGCIAMDVNTTPYMAYRNCLIISVTNLCYLSYVNLSLPQHCTIDVTVAFSTC